jgi:Xaa-Pro aminopeptidase
MAQARLAFSRAEYDRRAALVRAEMEARGVDVLILDEQEALAWVIGFDVTENLYRCCLLPRSGDPVMVVRALDEAPFRDRSWVPDAAPFLDWDGPIDRLVRTVNERGWSNAAIGLDMNSYCMPAGRFAVIRAALASVRWIDFAGVTQRLRLIKSAEEIAVLRRAAAIADQAILDAIAAIKPGGTDRDASAAAAASFVRQGAENHRVGRISAGSGWGFLHADLADRTLAEGDVVHLELCPRVHGYTARVMRPAVVGRASEDQQRVARVLIAAQDAQIAAMRPGALARDVDALGRAPILAAKLRPSYDNITGYTLGLYGSATPRTSDFTRVLHPRADWTLEPNQVFHVYNSAQGLAFSETVLVTNSGPERLTRLERKIFVV